MHGEYPINEQRGYTYTESDGTVDELVVGRLVGVFTNVATGKTVRRDLSGKGFFRTSPDGRAPGSRRSGVDRLPRG